MKSLETEHGSINNNTIEDDEGCLINRYDVENNDNYKYNKLLEINEKKKKPLLFYAFILSLIILLIFAVIFLIYFFIIRKNQNYIYEFDLMVKPEVSDFKYSNITFNNGLQVLLIQVGINETAGGTIVFDTGYLDTSYEYGYLQQAFSLLCGANFHNYTNLTDYLGNHASQIDEYYSSFSFNILNAGFFKYLYNFKNLSFLEEEDERFKNLNLTISNRSSSRLSSLSTLMKEKLLLEYHIFGYKNVNSSITNADDEKKREIMKSLVNPNKMKIVLASHFKPSLMKKKFLNIYKNVINTKYNKNEEKVSENSESMKYDDTNFRTKKVILFDNGDEENYIKFIFFVNKENDESYYDFSKKLGYFRYIKYILDETNEGSLYHELASNQYYTIKYMTCDFEVVLKKKIKFSIKIILDSSSYNHLDDISKKVYQYIYNHITQINKIDEVRYDELKKIVEQEFTFTEDTDDIMSFTKKLGIYLFDKKTNKNFLKDIWIEPPNSEEVKKLFSQLIPDNSVIILALTKETIKTIQKNSYNFFNIDNYNVVRKINHYISDLKMTIDSNDNENNHINNYSGNKYMSNKTNEIKKEEQKINNNKSTETIYETNLRHFKFLRETQFRLPKVHIMLNLFHPFLRPGNEQHCIYFAFMLYLEYIEKEINTTLADAIRAGNTFSITYDFKSARIEIFAFSDVAYDIMVEIKKILMNKDAFANIIKSTNTFQIYAEYTFEGQMNFRKVPSHVKAKNLFMNGLNNNTYKNYEFPIKNTEIKEKCYTTLNEIDVKLVTNFILDCQIYGYYSKKEAQDIVDLFIEEPTDEKDFQTAVSIARPGENINATNFMSWIKMYNNISDLTIKNITSNDKTNINQTFSYIYWSNFSSTNMIKINLFERILNNYNKRKLRFRVAFIEFNAIYLQLRYYLRNNEQNISEIKGNAKEKILEIYKNESEYYKNETDIVGNRFYYLKRNLIQNQYSRRATMEKSARAIYNSDFYVAEDLSELESNEISDFEYKDLIDKFNKTYDLFMKNQSYFDVLYYNFTKKKNN